MLYFWSIYIFSRLYTFNTESEKKKNYHTLHTFVIQLLYLYCGLLSMSASTALSQFWYLKTIPQCTCTIICLTSLLLQSFRLLSLEILVHVFGIVQLFPKNKFLEAKLLYKVRLFKISLPVARFPSRKVISVYINISHA